MKKIKVLLVDDSAVVRQVLQAVLDREPDIQVIGAVSDPIFAMQKLVKEWPDVIVLDVEMPRMDGITFLKKIMAEHPTPVVICSTLTEKGAETTMQALDAGAVEIITKPKVGLKNFLLESSNDLVTAVRAAAQANVRHARSKHQRRYRKWPANLMPMLFFLQPLRTPWRKPQNVLLPSAPRPAAPRLWKPF